MNEFTATYSPEDNKLRLRATARLPEDLYAKVRAAGFIWAPKQELFVAPMWTPAREDLLLELAGEVGDEDTSLVDRAEQRAERFEDYQDKRAADAERAREAVSSLADNIPLGQPILVGHHSERHARRDAAKIENGMRKAVKLWETSVYWEHRAAGALRHAKYKELPTVRARRIKRIEADLRRVERNRKAHLKALAVYDAPESATATLRDGRPLIPAVLGSHIGGLSYEDQGAFAKGSMPLDEALAKARRNLAGWVANNDRWIAHYTNRATYERAMLNEQGAGDLLAKKPKSAAACLPLLNYRAPAGLQVPNRYHPGEMMFLEQVEMTSAEYAGIYRDYKATQVVGNSHRIRQALVKHKLVCVFLTDSKTHTPPAPVERAPVPRLLAVVDERAERELDQIREKKETRERREAAAAPFVALREAVKSGVQVVSAPQLFPTPVELAARMVQLAGIAPGLKVLEPSAGTGCLADAIKAAGAEPVCCEINGQLADALSGRGFSVVCGDFLERFSLFDPVDDVGEVSAKMRQWDRVVMNPPFEGGKDIKHVEHALKLLRPGGRLVALCANGPRQRAAFMDRAEHWEDLPAGSFAESGTNVNVALLVLAAEELAETIPPMPATIPTKRNRELF